VPWYSRCNRADCTVVDVIDWYRIFSWLAVATQIALVLLLVARIAGATTAGARAWDAVRSGLQGQGLALAALVAAVATAGSLYLSEGAHLVPCRLCWYQRTMMYPLAVILVVAAQRRDW
jgi:disulfide bond formation protein DsbB